MRIFQQLALLAGAVGLVAGAACFTPDAKSGSNVSISGIEPFVDLQARKAAERLTDNDWTIVAADSTSSAAGLKLTLRSNMRPALVTLKVNPAHRFYGDFLSFEPGEIIRFQWSGKQTLPLMAYTGNREDPSDFLVPLEPRFIHSRPSEEQ